MISTYEKYNKREKFNNHIFYSKIKGIFPVPFLPRIRLYLIILSRFIPHVCPQHETNTLMTIHT